jgi:hypothetical protein
MASCGATQYLWAAADQQGIDCGMNSAACDGGRGLWVDTALARIAGNLDSSSSLNVQQNAL